MMGYGIERRGSTVFLTIAEAAELARVTPKTLRNLMANGTLIEGVHYTRPRGRRPLFKRDALLAWLNDSEDAKAVADGR